MTWKQYNYGDRQCPSLETSPLKSRLFQDIMTKDKNKKQKTNKQTNNVLENQDQLFISQMKGKTKMDGFPRGSSLLNLKSTHLQ